MPSKNLQHGNRLYLIINGKMEVVTFLELLPISGGSAHYKILKDDEEDTCLHYLYHETEGDALRYYLEKCQFNLRLQRGRLPESQPRVTHIESEIARIEELIRDL